MGYFPGYDLEPCWFCGQTSCNGNHTGPEADAASAKIRRLMGSDRHDTECCPCENCNNFRQRRARRKQPDDPIT